MPTRFFRAGAASVIYKDADNVGHFKRAVPPVGVWELQQGGIDLGESPEEALWRELKEELGCEVSDFEHVYEMPSWTIYQGLDSLEDDTHDRLGQAHKWFFLKLKPGIDIDLKKATHQEVSEYTWTNFETIIESAPEYKKSVYEQVYGQFKQITHTTHK
jgi:putative (di)nucleoside polyphosphate hydrolase